MSVEAPQPVPRKRKAGSTSSSSSVTKSSSVSVSIKDLDVRGLRGKLDELSMPQLRDILEDAGAMHNLISSLNVPQLDTVKSNRDSAAAENRMLAERNLESRPQLEELQNDLTSVESTVTSLMDTYTQYYEQLTQLLKKLDNQKIFSQLQKSVADLESQTEGVAENFLASRLNEEQFMDQYMQSRITYWRRKVKAEKMEELLNPAAPKLPPKRSQPPKPSPYRAANVTSNSVQMPMPSIPRTNTLPATQTTAPPLAAQPQPYHQPTATQQPPYRAPVPPVSAATQQPPYRAPVPPVSAATQQPPYRAPVPPVSAATQAAPYTQPPTQYQPQRPQYQYPPQRPPYQQQYPTQRPQYQQPPRNYPPQQPGYRPPAYPNQPYAPQPYQQPRQPYYYPQQQQPYRYR